MQNRLCLLVVFPSLPHVLRHKYLTFVCGLTRERGTSPCPQPAAATDTDCINADRCDSEAMTAHLAELFADACLAHTVGGRAAGRPTPEKQQRLQRGTRIQGSRQQDGMPPTYCDDHNSSKNDTNLNNHRKNHTSKKNTTTAAILVRIGSPAADVSCACTPCGCGVQARIEVVGLYFKGASRCTALEPRALGPLQ